MSGYNVLPGLPDEKKRLDACKELPRLERLAKEERKIWSDPREPVLEQRAKQLGPFEEKVEAELLEYGKRHRVLCDLERKVNLLKYDLKELKAEGNLIRAGEWWRFWEWL